MGISVLYNTEVYQFVSTRIPRESEITTIRVFDEYDLEVVPRYTDTLGDYVRLWCTCTVPVHEFGSIEIGLIFGTYKKTLRPLVDSDFLTAGEDYKLATNSERNPARICAIRIRRYYAFR